MDSPTSLHHSANTSKGSQSQDSRQNAFRSPARPSQPGFRKGSYQGTVGQLSFAPATQTTVVTTTTTTTTTLPPFVLKAPRHLRQRDPEQYPLAASPTPSSIKRLKIDLGEHATYFEEADDPHSQLQKFSQQQEILRQNGGTLQTISSTDSASQPRTWLPNSRFTFTNATDDALRNRSATPISLPDATELHSFHRRNSQQKSLAAGTGSRKRHPLRYDSLIKSEVGSGDSEADDESSTRPVHRSPSTRISQSSRKSSAVRRSDSVGGLQSPADIDSDEPEQDSASSSFTESDIDPFASIKQPEAQRRHPAPPNIDVVSAQDVSLPSPSLSPIRAAAHLNRPRSTFGALDGNDSDFADSHEQIPDSPIPASDDKLSASGLETPDGAVTPASVGDIPRIVETFDQLPDELKTYVMFQLLRRCAKPTLHFVAETVDPALRCDFLSRLPLELSLQVVDSLDAQSLCRAAQVSRKWRSLIDSDEKVWLNLLKTDGFRLPEGEIQRAIREGWGWQYLDSPSDWERESAASRARPVPDSPVEEPLASPLRRKRKLPSTRLLSSKRVKRRTATSDEVRAEPWMKELAAAQGPNAYAQAALAAVPDPQVGLHSLSNFHFFKSIYQRYYNVRRSWMDPNSKPLHLAFRAHQRHVVTCLQFDSDKILTGSDDANIDIYDTKTGASLSRLQGHDGGVWALEYQGDLLVSGSTDRTVRVWDMRRGLGLHVFQGHTSTVRCLQILKPTKVGETADGKPIMMPKQPLIITGSRDSTCRIWKLPKLSDPPFRQDTGVINDQENPYFVRVLSGHANSVRAIAAHADTLVSGSYDSTVRVWKVSTGELVHRLQGHTTKVYSVVLDYDRGRCISGSMDNTVRIWSLDNGACLHTLEGHTSLVGLLDLRDDVLVSAAADATLRIWDPESGNCRHTLTAHTGAITCFSHDGEKIISGSDRTLKMWNTQTGECVRDLLSDLSGVWQIKFDRRRCIAAVQRNNWTYIEVLDFGAARNGVPESRRGRRIIVDSHGHEVPDEVELDQVVEVNG